MSRIQHVIDIGDFSWPVRRDIYKLAKLLKERSQTGVPKDFYSLHHPMRPLRGLKCLNAFWEPSTRTALSFLNVGQDLGMEAAHFIPNFGTFSSAAKGEGVRRTIRVSSLYYDLIVMRHDGVEEKEGPRIAVEAVGEFGLNLSIVNAGDGDREHPTQALLDEFTIFEKKYLESGKTLNIALIGDVKHSRTIHSLLMALMEHDNIKIFLVTDEDDPLPGYVMEKIKNKPGFCYLEKELTTIASEVDTYYFTRYQVERREKPEKARRVQDFYDYHYGITPALLEKMKKDALVIHPMPIKGEIPEWFDRDPRAYYYQQVANGYFVRAALLLKIFRERPAVQRFFNVIGWREEW